MRGQAQLMDDRNHHRLRDSHTTSMPLQNVHTRAVDGRVFAAVMAG